MQKAKYLDPDTLSKIGPLDVVTRQVVEGIRIGMHRSPARGISTEFSAYRQYVPGDEIRNIDWKLYARSQRYFVKLFDAETNFLANLLLDASSSMTFGSGNITKLEYAKYMAASLAYLIVDQRDSAGVGIFDGELQQYIEPKSTLGILADISREMEKVDPQPRTKRRQHPARVCGQNEATRNGDGVFGPTGQHRRIHQRHQSPPIPWP